MQDTSQETLGDANVHVDAVVLQKEYMYMCSLTYESPCLIPTLVLTPGD